MIFLNRRTGPAKTAGLGCGLPLRLSPGRLFLSGGGGWARSPVRDKLDTTERLSATRRRSARLSSGRRRLLASCGRAAYLARTAPQVCDLARLRASSRGLVPKPAPAPLPGICRCLQTRHG